jgi:hypothetical protein
MSNNDKGGSGSSGTGGSAGAGADGAKNKTAKMSVDQAMAELEQARKTIGEKDELIADLTGQLKEANDLIEGQQKAKLIGEILPRSTFKMDELTGKSFEDLKNIRATLDQAIPPKVNSVRLGMRTDLSDREKGLTVGDQSYATRMKRKAQQETG